MFFIPDCHFDMFKHKADLYSYIYINPVCFNSAVVAADY